MADDGPELIESATSPLAPRGETWIRRIGGVLLVSQDGSPYYSFAFPFINVKAKGAVGDAKMVFDGTTTSQSNIVGSATAKWGASDVGKVVWVNWPSTGQNIIVPTTITQVDSSTQMRTAIPCLNGGTATGAIVCWATQDDTAAFEAAFAAAIATTDSGVSGRPPGTVYIPAGGYMISRRIYQNSGTAAAVAGPSIVGDGKTQTNLFVMPTFTVPGSGGIVINNVGYGGAFRDFAILGGYFNFVTSGTVDFVSIQQATAFDVASLTINNFGSANAGTAAFGVNGSSGSVRQLSVQNGLGAGASNMMAGRWNAGSGYVRDSILSNFPLNLSVRGNSGARSPAGSPLTFMQCVIDETAGATPTEITNGGYLNAFGCTFFGSPNYAIHVDGTSKLWSYGNNVGRFANYNAGGDALLTDSGGVVYSQGTTWRGNSAAAHKYIVNNGVFRNLGGNDYLRYSAADTFAVETAAQASSGNAFIDPGAAGW